MPKIAQFLLGITVTCQVMAIDTTGFVDIEYRVQKSAKPKMANQGPSDSKSQKKRVSYYFGHILEGQKITTYHGKTKSAVEDACLGDGRSHAECDSLWIERGHVTVAKKAPNKSAKQQTSTPRAPSFKKALKVNPQDSTLWILGPIGR